MVNISSSSGYTAVVPAPTKRPRPTTTANTVAIPPQGGSPVAYVGTTYATPALVATSSNVDHPNTYHNITSSGSSISVTSSASRQRRADPARAKRELAEARAVAAEARLEEIEADLELAAGLEADSVGRRMEDVQSEGGSITGLLLQLPTDVAQEPHPTATTDDNQFDGVFVSSASSDNTPSTFDIYDVFPATGYT